MRRFAHGLLSVLLLATLAPGTGVTICEAASHFGLDVHHHADRGSASCVGGHRHDRDAHEHRGDDPETSPERGESGCDRVPCSESCFSDLTEAPLSKGEAVPRSPVSDTGTPSVQPVEPWLPAVLRTRLDPDFLQPPDRRPMRTERSVTGRFLI